MSTTLAVALIVLYVYAGAWLSIVLVVGVAELIDELAEHTARLLDRKHTP